MIEIGPVTEHEMVLAFLAAEIDSPDYEEYIKPLLQRLNQSRTILIDNGDVTNATDNQVRMDLLKEYRGYSADAYLFNGFPSDVRWRRVEIRLNELERVKYGNFKDWGKLSEGSRMVVDGARNIGRLQTGEDIKDKVEAVVKKIERGHRFPELVTVQTAGDDLVLVEGHKRATAYMIAKPPYPIRLLIGSSSQIKSWRWY